GGVVGGRGGGLGGGGNWGRKAGEGVLGAGGGVGAALGGTGGAETVIGELRGGVERVRSRCAAAPRRRCVLLEWIAPPFRSGHWGPELVAIAGGIDPVGRQGEDAVEIEWDEGRAAAPDALVIACSGFALPPPL